MGVRSLLSIQKVNTNPASQAVIADIIRCGREYLAQRAGERDSGGSWFNPITVQDLDAAAAVFQAGGDFGISKSEVFWGVMECPSTPPGADVSFYLACLTAECCYLMEQSVDFLNSVRELLEEELETQSDPTKLAWVILSLRRIDELEGTNRSYEEALSRLYQLCQDERPHDGTERAYLGYNLLELGVPWDVVDDIAEGITQTYEVKRHQKLQETEAHLRFICEYAFQNMDIDCSIEGEYVDELRSKMADDEDEFLTKEELFPVIQGASGSDIDEDLSEDDVIERLIAFFQDNGFRVGHADVKAHSGIEIADIYPVELDRGGKTWKLAGVVKGPGPGTVTMKDISHQIARPAGIDSIDYIVLFNGKKTGANLSERLSELSRNLLKKEVIYISEPELAAIIS